MLERGRVEHRYDRLILVAPPHFLGTLRQVLDAQVQACVVAELDKELVAEPLDRLHARVQAHLARWRSARRLRASASRRAGGPGDILAVTGARRGLGVVRRARMKKPRARSSGS